MIIIIVVVIITKTSKNALFCMSKREKKKSVNGTRLNRDYHNLNKTFRSFSLLLLLQLITIRNLCVFMFLTIGQLYQNVHLLSLLIACSHLILCCCRRFVLSLACNHLTEEMEKTISVFVFHFIAFNLIFPRFLYAIPSS